MLLNNSDILIKKGYIPLDKSWMIRMGILDLINGYSDIVSFLRKQKYLSDDVVALYSVCRSWNKNYSIDVGESGTLYRFLQFVSWKLNLHKKFLLHGTLKKRSICKNPEITNYSLSWLLKLDNETSQWASAAVLLGNKEKIASSPYKLRLTYEAVMHWHKQRQKGQMWLPRYDQTILNQAETFLKILSGKRVSFKPRQSEDYCFARAFGFLNAKEGKLLWPSLVGHETNRLNEMEQALKIFKQKHEIVSRDHRVVQSITMLAKSQEIKFKVKYPDAVNKSWPRFWKFLEKADSLFKF